MVNEIDKIDEGEIEVTADELIILKELTNNTFINPGEDNSNKSISYPYDVTFYGVTITGILYVYADVDKSWTEGVVTGYVVGTYKLSKKKFKVNLYGPYTKLKIVFDFPRRKAVAKLYAQDILTGKWHGKGKKTLIRW